MQTAVRRGNWKLVLAAEAWRADIEARWMSEGRDTVAHVLDRAVT